MKKFILSLALFAVIFGGIDQLFSIVENRAPEVANDQRLQSILEGNTNYDLLIFGSSRGTYSYSTRDIEQQTGLNSFNLSYDGSSIEFSLFLLELVVKYNRNPQFIILTVDPWMFDKTINIEGYRIDVLTPLTKYPECLEKLIEKGLKDKVLSEIFYMHKISITTFALNKPPIKPIVKEYGTDFLISQNDWVDSLTFNDLDYDNNKPPDNKTNYIKFLEICNKNAIKLILVYPPMFENVNKPAISKIGNYTPKDTPIFIYDTLNTNYKDKNYFRDKVHLNKKGASVFSQEIIKHIKQNYNSTEKETSGNGKAK